MLSGWAGVYERPQYGNRKDLQFSVTIGFTSSTTTLTFLTAKVFARSSPTPEEPMVDRDDFSVLWLHLIYLLTHRQ